MRGHALFGATVLVMSFARPAVAAPFAYEAPGKLPVGSGDGRIDTKVYAPEIRFPIEAAPAFANSQVWGHGGANGPPGDQCDKENFSYPWHDNYCETREWEMPLCPAGQGHQGQDIRAATCKEGVHWVVAAADGKVTSIGTYSLYITAADGTRFDYLHMSNVAVKVGDKVTRGQRIGKVANEFDGTPTTVHLHFNIRQNVAGSGSVFVPPYMSLVQAYEDLLGLHKKPDAGPPPPAAPPEPAAEPEKPAPVVTPTPPPPPPAAEDGCAASSRAPDGATTGAIALAGLLVAATFGRRRASQRPPSPDRRPGLR
jgi:murein DD-endopeptidase MepM/ murein hydrolase activator NlpD